MSVGKTLDAIAVGAVVIAVAVWMLRKQRRLAAIGERAIALVVDLDIREEAETSQDGSTSHRQIRYPVVQFNTPDGAPVRTTVFDGVTHQMRQTGERIPVRYDPLDPKTVTVDSPAGRNAGMMYLAILVGAAMIVYGFYNLF